MSSPIDLCTVQDVRLYSPNVQGAQTDPLLAELVTSESATIESYCERWIRDREVDIVQTFSGEGSRLIAVPAYPITSVASVIVDGVAWPRTTSSTQPGYTFSERFLIAPLMGFPRGWQNVQVTYRAGYALETVPPPLKQACIELVDLRLQERKRQGVSGRTVGGEQVSYMDKDLPSSIKERLRSFVSVTCAKG